MTVAGRMLAGLLPGFLPGLLIVLGLAVGLAVLGHGLAAGGLLHALPRWAEPGVWRFAVFAGVFAVLAAAAFCTGPSRRGPVLVAGFLFWLVVAFGLGAVAAVALIGVGALAVGDLLFGAGWRERFGLPMAGLLSVCVGLVLLMELVGLLAHRPVNLPVLYLVLLTLPVLAGARGLGLYLSGLRAWVRSGSLGPVAFLAATVLLFVLALHSLYAALPEQYYDALAIHLLTATALAAQGQWSFDPGHLMTSVGPMGADWLFAVGYLLAGEPAAKLVNFGLLALISALLALEIGRGYGRPAGLLAAALFASLPLSFIETASLFSENALALAGLAGIILILRASDGVSRADAVAAVGLLAGAALVKLHGVFFLAFGFLGLLVLLYRQKRLMRALPALVVGALIAAPPYLYAFLGTGNPVFPYFNALFQSPLWPAENFSDPLWAGKLGWDLLYRWTFDSSHFLESGNGALGFALVVFILPGVIAALAGRDRTARLALLVGVGYLVCTVPFSQYLRYLYPILPVFALVCARTLDLATLLRQPQAGRVAGGLLALLALGLTGLDLRAVPSAGWILTSFDPQIVLDRSRQADWLGQRVPIRRFVEAVNALADGNARVLFIGTPAGAGLQGKPLYYGWYDQLLLREMNQTSTPAQAGEVLRRNHVTHVILSPGGPPQQVQAWLDQGGGRLLAQSGETSLYELLPDAASGTERLSNGDFSAGLTGWDRIGEPATTPDHHALIPPKGALAQAIAVQPGEVFSHSVRVLCGPGPSEVQLQVNWLDRSSTILATQVDSHRCSHQGEAEFVVQRVAGPGAAFGFFYLDVVDGGPLTVTQISVKKQ